MIYGIGTDIVSLERINFIYNKFLQRFIKKILSIDEQVLFTKLGTEKKIIFLAGRWASKEALVKALGTGFGEGIYLSDITINNNAAGKPFIMFNSNLEQILKSRVLKTHNSYKIHLTVSHEKAYATAFVVVEAEY